MCVYSHLIAKLSIFLLISLRKTISSSGLVSLNLGKTLKSCKLVVCCVTMLFEPLLHLNMSIWNQENAQREAPLIISLLEKFWIWCCPIDRTSSPIDRSLSLFVLANLMAALSIGLDLLSIGASDALSIGLYLLSIGLSDASIVANLISLLSIGLYLLSIELSDASIVANLICVLSIRPNLLSIEHPFS